MELTRAAPICPSKPPVGPSGLIVIRLFFPARAGTRGISGCRTHEHSAGQMIFVPDKAQLPSIFVVALQTCCWVRGWELALQVTVRGGRGRLLCLVIAIRDGTSRESAVAFCIADCHGRCSPD